MTEKEREALYQSILDKGELFYAGPERSFEELIDDFICYYEKTVSLAKKSCIYNEKKNSSVCFKQRRTK